MAGFGSYGCWRCWGFDRIVVAVSPFVDSGIGAFASARGDSFEDFGDGFR